VIDSWTGKDKLKHLGVSAALALIGTLALGPVFGALAALSIGAAKELLWDWALGLGDPSWKDFAADCAGVVLGVGLALLGRLL
jgi:uncharacterized protein YfiM (DUF2279 family)